jgi:hypothetical protein
MVKSVIKFLIIFCGTGFIVVFISAVIVSYRQTGYHSGTSPAIACINNLRQLDAAANQFALEHQLTNGDHINFPNDLTSYLKLDASGKIAAHCPSGGVYHLSKVGEAPTCSLGSTVTPAHVLP